MLTVWAASLLGCSTANKPATTNSNTQLLDSYLYTHFNKHIADSDSLYVLISETGCIHCSEVAIQQLASNKKCTTIVSTNSYNQFFKTTNGASVLIDSTNDISRLTLTKAGVAIAHIRQGQIDTIVYLSPALRM